MTEASISFSRNFEQNEEYPEEIEEVVEQTISNDMDAEGIFYFLVVKLYIIHK